MSLKAFIQKVESHDDSKKVIERMVYEESKDKEIVQNLDTLSKCD